MVYSYKSTHGDSGVAKRFINFLDLSGFAPLVRRWSDKSQLLGKTKVMVLKHVQGDLRRSKKRLTTPEQEKESMK